MGQLANNEWREGWLDEGFSDFQEGWLLETHGGPPAYDGLEPDVLLLELERWSEPVSTVSERFRDFLIYQEMVYAKAQLFYEQLRYVVGDETMRRILRVYFSRWKLKHVDEDAFRRVAEEVSKQDLKWLFGEWLHATPLIDYRLRRVERHRLADGRWRTVVTVERKGDGRMPVEIGERDAIYARATGEPATERVEFTTAKRPGRRGAVGRSRAATAPRLRSRPSRGVRCPVDGDHRSRLRRPPPVGRRGDSRGGPVGLDQNAPRGDAAQGAAGCPGRDRLRQPGAGDRVRQPLRHRGDRPFHWGRDHADPVLVRY